MKKLSQKFNPGTLMNCFVIFFLPLLLFLGYWQITKGFEKKVIWETYNNNKTLPPISEREILEFKKEDLMYRSVALKGSYIDKSFLLDNRIYQSKKGYEVFSPFMSVNKKLYLVNRGWTNNKNTYFFSAPEGYLHIEGIVSPFTKYGLDLSTQENSGAFPLVLQELTYSLVISLLEENIEIENLVIQLSAASKGSFEPVWGPSELKAARHWGYATQWLGLALALIFLYLYFGFNKSLKK